MEEKRTGLFENGLIWFGAGVSIAEILTGTYLAPLGMGKGLAAIIVGHIIGWVIGFVVYRILMNVDMPVGNTLPDMVITIILCLIAGKLIPEKNQKK